MSSASSGNGQNSSGNGTNGGANGPSGTPPIREFIYLNQNKIFSYLSQMEGGLRLLYSKVREEAWSETIGDAEKTTEVGLSASGTVEGKIAFLAGISGDVTGDWRHTVASGGDSRQDSEKTVSSEIFGLHHKAFDLVLEHMRSRLIVKKGRISFIHMDFLLEQLEKFPDTAKNLNALNGGDLKPPPHTKQMHILLKRFMENKIIVILRESNDQKTTAYLAPEFLTGSIDSVIMDYGAAPTMDFTLVGISAPGQAQASAGDFSVQHYDTNGAGMAAQLNTFAGSIGGMSEFFQLKSVDGHVAPLALYLEL